MIPPNKFVNLHGHSTAGSPFDAIGYPQQHIDFAISNGMDALALTDHGNMNGLPYQVLHSKELNKNGTKFKPIYGAELYFHPDLDHWRWLKEEEVKKKTSSTTQLASGAVVEDEGETKNKKKNPLKKRNHLVVLAKNQAGLNNLFQLISKSFTGDNFYSFPRIDYSMLEEHHEGLIVASACLGGVYAGDMHDHLEDGDEAVLEAMRKTTRRMQSIFGKKWLGELQWLDHPLQHKLNKFIIQISKEFDVPLISTCDSHYHNPEIWKDRTLYKKLNPKFISREIEKGSKLPDTVDEVGYELFPKNASQMWEAYKKYSELGDTEYDDEIVKSSIELTYEIAHEWIEDFYPDTSVRLPDFIVPEDSGMSADELLKQACEFHLAQKGLSDDDEGSKVYIDRLAHELSVIADRGFSSYFLTMKAASDEAQKIMLTGPGRGSAAGALVSYLLGITQIDPIRWDLSFARFLRSDAVDYPDIDYDVSDPMRFKDILIDKWGRNNVVPISNWTTLKPKTLIKDISRFYGLPFVEANKVTTVMEEEAAPKKKRELGMKSGVVTLTFDDLKKYSPTLNKFLAEYPQVETHLDILHGQVKACSRHAGGVVIGQDLDRYMPLIRSGKVTQTPWSEGQNVRHLEPMGFIKFDFLGLATLKMIEDCIELILKRHHGIEEPTYDQIKEWYNKNLHTDIVNFNDQKVYENVFHNENWAGIFQFAEEPMQKFATRVKPRSLEDLTALTSIWRPGPIAAGVPERYLEVRNSGDVKFPNEYLKQITKETKGFLIYQEQIAKLACTVGENISEDEGNVLRKLIIKTGSSKKQKKLDAIYNKFITGASKKGMSRDEADSLWQLMKNFAAYGFNKSHALSYSTISFQTAWLLTYYPVEWLCGFMNAQGEKKKEKSISIVQPLGFAVKGIDINESNDKWTPSADGKTLIQPLNTLKGMGDKAMKKIMTHRPYSSIDEMLFGDKKLGKKELNALVKIGALDHLIDERFNNRKHLYLAAVENKPQSKKRFRENILNFADEPDFTNEENIDNLVSITGVYPISMVLDIRVKRRLDNACVPQISDFDPELGACWFIPREIIVKNTKSGRVYWQVLVTDDSGGLSKILCWNIKDNTRLFLNRPYISKLDYNEKYGLSTNSINHNFKLLG